MFTECQTIITFKGTCYLNNLLFIDHGFPGKIKHILLLNSYFSFDNIFSQLYYNILNINNTCFPHINHNIIISYQIAGYNHILIDMLIYLYIRQTLLCHTKLLYV